MMDVKNIEKAIVRYNGKIVGYLVELDGEISFQYDDAWLLDGFSISPFSLPLSNKIYVNKKSNFGGLYGVFANSLPDGWGELLMIRRLALKGINYERLSPITKLSLLGENAKGALTYEPTQVETAGVTADLDEMALYAKEILEGMAVSETELDKMVSAMGSSGGARPKANVNSDGREWIVKFRGSFDSASCGNEEFSANQTAKECGLNVNDFRLFPSKKGSGYFGAARFDREGGKKIHMISLSYLLETSFRLPNLDYMHLFKVVKQISRCENDIYEAYGRMCFNVLYGNKDDHGNNFSFLYDESLHGYRLSPFYDITNTPNMGEHSMSVLGKGNPDEDDLLEIGEAIRLPRHKCLAIIEKIKATIS